MVRLSSSTLRRLNPSPLKRGSDPLYDPELAAEPPSRVTWELE